MEIGCKALWILHVEKNISLAALRGNSNIASETVTRYKMKLRHEAAALLVLLRIREYLDCSICDVYDAVNADEV